MSTSNQELDRNLKTFKKYKNLLKELTAKNVKLKYRNSWLGILWSFIQPLLQMIVLSVVFGGIFGRSNKHVICFPVYLFTGRLLFSFFTSSTKQAMTSFRRNAGHGRYQCRRPAGSTEVRMFLNICIRFLQFFPTL